jgi:hypothetical protein
MLQSKQIHVYPAAGHGQRSGACPVPEPSGGEPCSLAAPPVRRPQGEQRSQKRVARHRGPMAERDVG